MKKYCLLVLCLCGCCQTYDCNIDSAFTDSNIQVMVSEAETAFIDSEKELLDIKPDDILRPHPDPTKCICKGTGIIQQGDQHVTKCPFHGNSTSTTKR